MRDDTGLPSASKIMIADEKSFEEEPIEYEEQLEDELEHDEEAVIQPPTQHTFTPASRLARRTLPIPADAEFVSIEDSDEEAGLGDQEPIKLGRQKVVEVEFQESQHEDGGDEQNIEHEHFSKVDEFVEDTAYMYQPLDSTPPSEAEIFIATWPRPSSSDQQDGISVDDYEPLYSNIEAITVQAEEQAGNYNFSLFVIYH